MHKQEQGLVEKSLDETHKKLFSNRFLWNFSFYRMFCFFFFLINKVQTP